MEQFAESKDKFDNWLNSVVKTFANLLPHQQEATVKRLINGSSPELKYVLMHYFSKVLQQDIFSFLPNELKAKVCSYVDGKSLLKACNVSKNWNRAISSLEKVWHIKCVQDGFQAIEASSWKGKYVQGVRFIERIHTGRAFFCKTLRVNMFGGDEISELFINNEYVFASAGKQVSIWYVGTHVNEIPVLYFTTRHRISSMCECELQHLICGHTSGHLSIWVWKREGTVEETAQFVGHVGPVACVAVSKELGLIASGGADCVVKLWCLESKQLLLKHTGYSSIIRKVMLRPTSYSDVSNNGKFVLLIKSKNVIKVCQWSLKPGNLCCSSQHGILEEMLNDTATVVIEDYYKNFFPDQYCFAQGKLIYVRTSLNDEIVLYDLNSKQDVEVISLADKYPFVLAVGKKFALVMRETESSDYGFALLNLKMKSEMVKWLLPISRSDRHAILRVAVPDSLWLDDFGHHIPGQLMLAFTDTLDQINVVFWNASTKMPD